jgi:hypothetical protein
VGAPEGALVALVAPIAPDPLVPVVSIPVKVITVMEEATLAESVAVALTLVRVVGAKARQISDVPLCPLERTTKVHVSPAPAMLLTTVPEPVSSVETKASSSSLAATVENVCDVTVLLALFWSPEAVASMAMELAADTEAVKLMFVTFALLTVAGELDGVMENPDFVGVTV